MANLEKDSQSMTKREHEYLVDVAQAYVDAPHSPRAVAWDTFRIAIAKQYQQMTETTTALRRKPLRVYPTDTLKADTIYATAEEMFDDIRLSGMLYVYTGGSDFAVNHPLEYFSFLKDANGDHITWNTAFRAVHDYFGHYAAGADFGYPGELEAYAEHARVFKVQGYPEALPVLFAETVGQLAYHYATRGRFVPIQEAKLLEPR
jgi:hypothetical protein